MVYGYREPTLDGSFGGGWYRGVSDDLFRCKRCNEITDKDQKNGVTITKWATKASARAALCDKCFTNFVSVLDFKFGDWKAWPKRGRKGDDDD